MSHRCCHYDHDDNYHSQTLSLSLTGQRIGALNVVASNPDETSKIKSHLNKVAFPHMLACSFADLARSLAGWCR